MGIFDKLKNVFFEEEYVEVEEPVKKEKVTVAKKIETPEVKKERQEAIKQEKEVETKEDIKETPKGNEHDFKFPMAFDDKDFEVEEKPVPPMEEPIVENVPVYREKVEVVESTNEYHSLNNYQGLYEGSDRKDKKSGFSPSPIISPIYGILDKNYKKEEIVTKKEIRLSVTSKKVDLDYVREKAYGDLANEITESIHEDVKDKEKESVDEDNLLYDLNDDDSPAVKVVTVGDAEEYFNDLGLEYNVDYKVEDEKKEEKTVTRRADRKKNDAIMDEEKESVKVNNNSKPIDIKDDDSNLFDLIDSMYEDKE